jgi:chromosome segregation ATPase
VDDLSGKVAALSIDMMDAAKDMAGHSQQSAAAIIEKTDAWSESTSVRLEALLSNIEDRSRDFREAGQALLEAKTFMNNLLVQNATALSQMAEASRNVQAYSAGLVGQSDGLRALNQQQLQTSTKLQETVASLNAVFDRHQALLETYDDGLAAFKDVIEPLDQTLARIMSATTKGLSDYNEKVEANFDSIVEIADKLVPKAASLLSQQIDDLREQLETLGEVIAKAVERVDG